MRCPTCGSPVRVYASRWECGWCGDYGLLRRRPVKEQKQVSLEVALSFIYHVDLSETWSELKKALTTLAPSNDSLLSLLGKVLLHNISVGIHQAGALSDEIKAEELQNFLENTSDLNLGESAKRIMHDIRCGILFGKEAALSETECGTFWTELISIR